MTLDVLAFGPHPDDVEIFIGGTLLKLGSLGYSIGIIDLSAGEAGTRGTRELRSVEAQEGSKILGASLRETLDLGDGRLIANHENRLIVAGVIRKYCPRLVFTAYPENSHPDHAAAGPLVSGAAYLSGLEKLDLEGEPHRPNRVLYYDIPHKTVPSFIIDVTAFHEEKRNAICAHRSQLYDTQSIEPETFVSAPDFLGRIDAISRYFGSLIDVEFGEAFYIREAMKVDDLMKFFADPFNRIS